MAPHSSTLAWKIPWMEEPGGLQSMGSLRVGHDRATSLSLFTFMHWRRKWQLTPAFLPGESQGRGSLMGCRLWGLTESDTTEATQQQQQQLHASNLHQSSILPMVIYMFQFQSLKSFHPRLLPQSPKVSSLHLCLFCCPVYRIIVTIFLNFIYMC